MPSSDNRVSPATTLRQGVVALHGVDDVRLRLRHSLRLLAGQRGEAVRDPHPRPAVQCVAHLVAVLPEPVQLTFRPGQPKLANPYIGWQAARDVYAGQQN